MPSHCSVVNCKNRSDQTRGVSYFRFPFKKYHLLKQWIAKVGRDRWQPKPFSYVCSDHFEEKFIYETSDTRRLLGNAVPTIFPSRQRTIEKPTPPTDNLKGSCAPLDEDQPSWIPPQDLSSDLSADDDEEAVEHPTDQNDPISVCDELKQEIQIDFIDEEDCMCETETDPLQTTDSVFQQENQTGKGEEPSFQMVEIKQEMQTEDSLASNHNGFFVEAVDCQQEKDISSGGTVSKAQYKSLQILYGDVCERVRMLRERVKTLELDKVQLQSSLRLAQREVAGNLKEIENQDERQLAKELKRQTNIAEEFAYSSLETFAADEGKLKFYTGLPSYAAFKSILKLLSVSLGQCRGALGHWQNLLLTLMRLRLSLTLQDLAYRFGVSTTTINRYFEKYIDALYRNNYPLKLKWPNLEKFWDEMSQEFQAPFSENRLVVIIECFELFSENPRASVQGDPKHIPAVKIFIAIRPVGGVIIASSLKDSAPSEKRAVQESGLYELIPPNNAAMNRDIAKHIAQHGAKLLLPAYTRGKLSARDEYINRKLIPLCVHVQTTVAMVRKKYSILKGILTLDMLFKRPGTDLSLIDKIVQVCWLLTEMGSGTMSDG